MKARTMIKAMTFKIGIALCAAAIVFGACSKRSVESGAQGAATGAVVGAVGGLVTGLVFGNAAESAARGAVYGASTGAAAGAISGAVADSNEKKAQQAAEMEALRKKLGDDAFQGLEALVTCKHEIAQGYGRTAAKASQPDHALAGLWIQVLAYADNNQADKAESLYPDLIAKDDNISSPAQADQEMQKAMQQLMEIRKEHKLPAKCS